MAEVLMDNPLSPAPTLGAHYLKILQNIKDCVDELKQEFDDSGGYPINDDIHSVHRLCGKLEYLLQAGIKTKTTLLGNKKDYWNYMCDCLSSNKSLSDGIRFVKSISEIQTSLGSGRALLRFCLMHHRLADTLQQCVYNLKVTSDWYHPKSIWFDRKLVSELLNILYDLNDLQFDLPPRDCNLDATWPNFASRRTFGGPQNWGSRAISVTSLASIPNMEAANTPPASPHVEPDPEVLRLQTEAQEINTSKEHMEKLLEVAEHEKHAVEARLEQGQKEMDVKIINMEKEIMALKTDLIEWQKKVTEKEIENDKLTAQLQLKETVATEKEVMLRIRAEEAEKLLVAFKDDFVKSGKPMTANEKFDIMELRGQMVVQKKKNQALELNLKSAELELASKVKVDAKKTELINLLDKKLNQQQQKIDYLLTTAETLVKEKETQAKKLVIACEELTKLSKRYVDNEKITNELRKHNNQLKAMLNSLDGKGKQLAELAKEKIKTYMEQNKKLQSEMDVLKHEVDTGKESMGTNIKALETTLTTTCSDILVQVANLVQKENLDDKGQDELAQIQDRLKSLEQAKLDLTGSIEASASREAIELKSQLSAKTAEMSKQEADLASQIENLKEENLKLKQEVDASQGQGQEGDNKGTEALLEEIKGKDVKLETVKAELAAIRALVLGSMGGGTQEAASLDVTDDNFDIFERLELLLQQSTMVDTARQSIEQTKDDAQAAADPGEQVTENALLKTLNSQGDQMIDLQSKLKQLEQLLQDKSLELTEITGEMSCITEERERLQIDLARSEVDIQAKDERILEMTGRIEAFSKELLELRESQEVAVKEKNGLHEQFKVTEQKMSEMEENFVTLMMELTSVKDQNNCLTADRNQSALEYQDLQLEKLDLEETVTSLHSCLENSEQTFSEMRSCIEEHELEKKKLEDKLEQQSKQNEDSQLRYETLQLEKNDLELKKQELVKEYEGNMEIFDSTKAELETQLEQTEKEMEELHSKITGLESNLLERLSETEKVEGLLQASKSKESDLVEQLKDVEDKIQQMHQEKVELESKAKEFNYEFMCGKSALEAKESAFEESQKKIEENESKVKELTIKLEGNERDKDKMREELEEARNMVRELQLDVKPIVQETDKQPMVDLQKEDEYHMSAAVIIPNVQVENVNLRQQIESLLTNKDELCRKVVDEKSIMEEHMNCLIKDIEDKSRELDSLQNQNKSLKDDLCSLQKDCDGKSEAIQTLMENMELSRVEMEALRSTITELDVMREGVAEAERRVLEAKEEMTKKEGNWLKEKDGWEKEVSAVKFQMSAKEMEYQETTKMLEGQLSEQKNLGSQVRHCEALVDTLELELRQLREEKEHEQDRGVELHRELQKVLQENKILARELVTTNGLLQEEKRDNVCLKKHFGETTEHLSESEASLSKQVLEHEMDNTELKKKVIRLVREKDSLWQKITRLEHDQYLRASDKWMEDAEVTKCLSCSAEFSLVLRKHHCRLCGRIFCHDCCNHWVMTPHSSKKERVCASCLMSHSLLETPSENGSDTPENDFLDTVEIPERRSTKWSESVDIASDEESESGDQSNKVTDASEASAEACAPESGLELDEARLLSMTDDNKSEVNQLKQDTGIVNSESIDHSSETGDCAFSESVDGTLSERADTDEAYDMITADEVLDSMSEPVPDPNLETHDTITVEQIESGSPLCPPELSINAGKIYAVPIFLENVGVTFCWEFTTKPKGISFSLTYKENEFVSTSYQETLIGLCKCDSHKEPVTGNLTARKPGIYTLLFDNSSSRFTSKKIDFSLKIMDVENISCT